MAQKKKKSEKVDFGVRELLKGIAFVERREGERKGKQYRKVKDEKQVA